MILICETCREPGSAPLASCGAAQVCTTTVTTVQQSQLSFVVFLLLYLDGAYQQGDQQRSRRGPADLRRARIPGCNISIAISHVALATSLHLVQVCQQHLYFRCHLNGISACSRKALLAT